MPDSDAKSLPTRGEGSGQHSDSSRASGSSASAGSGVGGDASNTGSGKSPSNRPSGIPRPGGAEALIGTILGGRYKIEKLLGEGGMGAVYQAEHTHMRKRLAVKVLHPEMSRLPEVVARFEREAMAAAHIDHPNVAAATDFGKLDDGSFFLVLEFVEGQSLRDLMNLGRLDVGRALRILRQVSGALGQAHALGIVHRDLKPENVMLVERGGDPDFVKVLDFGIAKVPVGDLAKEAPGSVKGPVLTQLGMVYGTPEYMAPEQALGQNVDPRADIYALGVLTFEMLAGVRPFDHESKVTLLGMHVTAPVPSIAQKSPEANVPPEVEAIIIRMLAKEATQRYVDAKELVEVLDSIWQPEWGSLPGPGSQVNPRASQLGLAPLRTGNPLPVPLGSAPTQVAIPSSSLEILGHRSPIQKLTAKLKENPKPLIFGGLVLSAFFGVMFLKGAFDRTTHDRSTIDDAGNVVIVTMLDAQVVSPALDAQVTAAIELVDKGDYGTAISQLTALETQAPDRADIHRALERAYEATQDTPMALQELKLLFATDPATTSDQKLETYVRNAALVPATQEAAFAIMATGMGTDGPDAIYNTAYVLTGYPGPSEHARRLLSKPEVRAKAGAPLLVTLDLRNAGKCDAKKALLPRASADGDNYTLSVLKQYQVTKGCGFLNQRDCWSCMHKDGSLSSTIRDIEARLNK
jgi:serine/threonine protein kinase